MDWTPRMTRSNDGAPTRITRGHPDVDRYLELVGARARENTLLAMAFDVKVFFSMVPKEPAEVTTADVSEFIAAQRAPRHGTRVVRLEDGEAGLSARTIKRRVSSISGLFRYLVARGDAGVSDNPVPYELTSRRPSPRPGRSGPALIRTPRTLPRVLSPGDVDASVASLRTRRDRAMVLAMLLGGLRRCEVLGLRLSDVNRGERRVFVADGKGGTQRYGAISPPFFAELGEHLVTERPKEAFTEQIFLVSKGPRRAEPLSNAGLEQVMKGARGVPAFVISPATSCATPA